MVVDITVSCNYYTDEKIRLRVENQNIRVVAYTCRYSSGELIPVAVAELKFKGPLEYLQVGYYLCYLWPSLRKPA